MEFSEVDRLAEEARLPLYPARWPRDPHVRESFTAGAILGAMLFSRRWLLAATAATRGAPKAANNPWRYWLGCLRNGLVEVEGFAPWPTREEHASYFAQLMHAVAPAAAAVIAECREADAEPVAASGSTPPTAIERYTPQGNYRDKLRQWKQASGGD